MPNISATAGNVDVIVFDSSDDLHFHLSNVSGGGGDAIDITLVRQTIATTPAWEPIAQSSVQGIAAAFDDVIRNRGKTRVGVLVNSITGTWYFEFRSNNGGYRDITP